jgi:hypothetical protein
VKEVSKICPVIIQLLYTLSSYSLTFQYMLRNCRSFTSGKSEVNYVKDKYSSCYSKGKKKANY